MIKVEAPYPKRKLFLTCLCCLAAAPYAKIGEVQALEIFLFFHLLYIIVHFALAGFRCRIYTLWRSLGIPYALFIALSMLMAIASVRFRFYPPPHITFLKMPLLLSIARLIELGLGIFYMLYLASILRREPDNLRYAMKAYFWAGVASAVYSLACYPLLLGAHLEWGVYLPDYRVRGWFNEGGPYGLYLASVIVVGLLSYDLGSLKKVPGLISGTILLCTLAASQSKAAFFAGGTVLLLNLLLAGSFKQRVTLALIAAMFGIAVWNLTPLPALVLSYVHSYQLAQQFGAEISASVYGGLEGRVGGAILVPRMILAHPISGIGIGNYSLLRNSPEYLQGLPPTNIWDLPGIGLAAYIAELGIPLFAYLILLLCVPAWMTRHGVSVFAFILAAYQPIAHIFGVQLNFYYPWICSGMALSVPSVDG